MNPQMNHPLRKLHLRTHTSINTKYHDKVEKLIGGKPMIDIMSEIKLAIVNENIIPLGERQIEILKILQTSPQLLNAMDVSSVKRLLNRDLIDKEGNLFGETVTALKLIEKGECKTFPNWGVCNRWTSKYRKERFKDRKDSPCGCKCFQCKKHCTAKIIKKMDAADFYDEQLNLDL